MSAAITYVLREHGFRAGPVPPGLSGLRRLNRPDRRPGPAQVRVQRQRLGPAPARDRRDRPLHLRLRDPRDRDHEPSTGRWRSSRRPTASSGSPTPTRSRHPGDLSQLYPTGVRNYARVYPADDLEAAALAQFTRRQTRASVYVAPRRDRLLQPGQRHLLPDRRPTDRPAPRRIGHLEPTAAHLRPARRSGSPTQARAPCTSAPRRRRPRRRQR